MPTEKQELGNFGEKTVTKLYNCPSELFKGFL